LYLAEGKRMRIRQITCIFARESHEFFRDKILRVIAFAMPLSIMLIFGYGLALDVENVPMAIVDEDHTPASRELSYKFIENKQYFDFKGFLPKVSAIEDGILSGRLRFGLVIPSRFYERLKEGKSSSVQVLIDGSFPSRASVAKTYALGIISNFNLERLGTMVKKLPLRVETRYWFNENLKQRNITVCGLIPIILSIAPTILTSLLVVREKERGSIYNIWTSSITKAEFLVGKQLFALAISMVNFFNLFLITVLLFRVPFKGNFFLLLFWGVLYILVSTSEGLVISCFVKTQVVAVLGTVVITLIPAFLYSGYLVPVSSMSADAYLFAHAFPPYYGLSVAKGLFLKAAGFRTIFPKLLVLFLFYVIYFSLAIHFFKKRES